MRDFHDGLETERVGIIFGGQDLSVSEGEKFYEWKITKVVDNKTTGKLEISCSAKYNGMPVDPCNAIASPTAPIFFNLATFPANEGGLSIIRSYAKGDDYVAARLFSGAARSGERDVGEHDVRHERCATMINREQRPTAPAASWPSRASHCCRCRPT